MREIKVTISGDSPLLMHNIAAMGDTAGGKVKSIPTKEEEAAAGLYWLNGGHKELAVPARCVHSCLLKASGKFKVGKASMSSLFAGSLHVEPEMVPLSTREYRIDTRSAVIQKNRVLRSRASVFPWSLTFDLIFDEEWITLGAMGKSGPEIIKAAGKIVGLLDYRPEKKGSFGTFHLVKYELLPPKKQAVVAAPEIIGFGPAKEA